MRATAGGRKLSVSVFWAGAFLVAVSFIFAVLGNGRGKMRSLLTFGSSVPRESQGCARTWNRSPEAAWFELSLIGHVTSLSQFPPLKRKARMGVAGTFFIFMLLYFECFWSLASRFPLVCRAFLPLHVILSAWPLKVFDPDEIYKGPFYLKSSEFCTGLKVGPIRATYECSTTVHSSLIQNLIAFEHLWVCIV